MKQRIGKPFTTKEAPVITQDELMAAIEEARRDFGAAEEVRPPGALSIDEWCKKLGLRHTAMREKMKSAVAVGLYEKIMVRTRDVRGYPYSIPVYRKVKQVKNAMDRIR